ncbi:SDR family oxidoreductase [Bacillus bingmayongensis]|uniref:SDR family oxidoreductase n=1 Tax=Bacillus bingmayongensis TaxID=1150157 RepID=UPI0002FD6A23|nr:SDR family oxidoreductase [Bacillus bingmayongensis]MBY0600224.1 SDR family oxidoreductase [Bacillus bingmayongensis]
MSKTERRTALVLASSDGLGLAVAKGLYRDGHNVIITSRSGKLEKAKQEICAIDSKAEVLAVQSDVTKIDDLNKLIMQSKSQLGNIDILFTNVAGPKSGTIEDLTLKDFSKAHNDLLLPVIYLTKKLISDMVSRKWGRIIINSSITAKEPSEMLTLSNVYRAGLASFSKTLAHQFASHGITVNTVGPGSFKTARALELLSERSKIQNRKVEDIELEIAQSLPMKRYNEPIEFGNVVAFLASDAASAITGTFIPIDGGISRGVF